MAVKSFNEYVEIKTTNNIIDDDGHLKDLSDDSELSEIPFLKLLIPLATSPIKSEIFPRPNKRTTRTTTIAICQKPILM